ncbi:Prolyl 4-hydroxylase subunit alpha-1 [Seminavis robusta]|uniref:Prolyl 4-hydroxylase subunit alpha-1 n=1 Tax=Seminavis robusta TaxID=568900 RepID=A0A9N8H2U8_9STRA|nr:Prolyl 4-hydroxylase subunit alpha-1 [Seminavis robusta]|eukprot:Sro44_g026550.1 Prolyl 4-hydroxylase subunit alpha-1 (423) ;mRNA; f:37800-39537
MKIIFQAKLLIVGSLIAYAKAGGVADSSCNVGKQASLDAEIGTTTANDDDYGEPTNATSSARVLYQAPTPARKLDSVGGEMGVAQTIDVNREQEIYEKIAEARYYMVNEVNIEPEYDAVRDICKNKHESCAFWAMLGECEKNPNYMKLNCAPICQTCDFLSIETRCPLDPNAVDALYPGDITKMFNRILTDPSIQQYQPTIVSRPEYAEGDTAETANYILGPWMVVFENALTDEEADRMIELGGNEGYQRSADVGRKLEDGTYDKKIYAGRTSTNAWCQNDCYEDPIAKRLMQRVEDITGVPEPNSEWLQLLRYEQNQHYNRHHDLIEYQKERQCGVRIFTLYFYLNDVEEGGGTEFPALNLTVTPKRGRAALWPSVYDHDPNLKDPRTEHAALPVTKGVKYGANAWLHQRDFKNPHREGCN